MKVVSSVGLFSPSEVAQLAMTTGVSQSSAFTKRQGQLLGFLQALGSRIGFPQRTIATSQVLFLRFFLFYNPAEFALHDVANACTVMASKINDTPKKAREVILSSWALRFPDMVRGGTGGSAASGAAAGSSAAASTSASAGATSTSTGGNTPQASTSLLASGPQLGLGIISESDVDPVVMEKERKRVVSIESLLLQSIAFDFNLYVAENFRLTIKISKAWHLPKALAQLAWQICADCHRTYMPLSYPPSSIALASIYCAALLWQSKTGSGPTSKDCQDVIARLQGGVRTDAEADDSVRLETLKTSIENVEEVVHTLLDLYIGASPLLNLSALSNTATPISPATPASPAEPPSDQQQHAASGAEGHQRGRQLPSHVFSPPPFGLLFYISLTPDSIAVQSAGELSSDFTRIKISLRQAEDERRAKTANGDQQPEAALLSDPYLAATLVRELDVGGLRGDAEQPQLSGEMLLEAWQKRSQDRQFASLQRYLF